MRKLKLGVKGVQDILTREELRKITGGIGSGSEGNGSTPPCNCYSPYDCGPEAHAKYTCSASCEGGQGYGHCVEK